MDRYDFLPGLSVVNRLVSALALGFVDISAQTLQNIYCNRQFN